MKDLIIGIDAGTSVIKSVAFDLAGKQVGIASVPNEYTLPEAAGAEQNMAATWGKTLSTLTMLAEQLPGLGLRTAAVAVTGQGDGTWLMDAAGEPVGDALLWLDARAAGIAEELSKTEADSRRFELTGTGLVGCQQGPQLRWLLAQRPELIARAATSFHCKDWLYYKLTGDISTDPSEGLFSFGNFRTREYSDEVVDALGLTAQRNLLPNITEGTETSGSLDEAVASKSGLLAGTPVVLGYVDVICTALGSGLYSADSEPGVSIVGSTGMHMRVVKDAAGVALNPGKTGYVMSMPVPGVYAQMQSNMAATLNIDWLLDLAMGLAQKLGTERNKGQLLELLDDWVESAEPGAVLYQPYISEAGERGPFVDASARAGFTGLSTRHGIEHLARAIFEGLCFAARDCYTTMGSVPTEIRLSGGAARSRQLTQILSATLGASIRSSSREEAGAAGAAMMAAVSIGHYATMGDCVNEWVTPLLGDTLQPDTRLAQRYSALFPSYVEARTALRPVWQSLAQSHQNQQ